VTAATAVGQPPEPATDTGPTVVPVSAEPAADGPAPAGRGPNDGIAPRDDRAVAVELGPIVGQGPVEPASAEEPAASREPDDAEADPEQVRERIATASRSFDPDDQIRRAMEAFLSPPNGREARPPDA